MLLATGNGSVAIGCRLRSILYVSSLAALFYGLIPAMVLSLTGRDAILHFLEIRNPLILGVLLIPPIALGVWATLQFTDFGYGTPLPLDPPKHMVTSGPYAYVRNPMQITGLSIGVLRTLYQPTPAMLLYVAGLLMLTLCVFRPYEHRQMLRLFGDEYSRYRLSVRNWIPKTPRYERGNGSRIGGGQ